MTVPLQVALWTVLGVALVISVVTDVASRRILDAVTLPAIAVALAVRLWREGVGDLESGLVSGLVAGGAAAGLFAALALRGRGFGWGDVKLMGAVGASLGYPSVLSALVFISLVGALQALSSLVWQGALWQTVSAAARRLAARVRLVEAGPEGPRRHIPYGVAIALGSFWAMWWERSHR